MPEWFEITADFIHNSRQYRYPGIHVIHLIQRDTMQNIQHLIDYILHIDVYLNAFVSTYGFWTYLALFAVIFCETGLIVTPFLPGDSLLFAAGSIAAQPGNPMNIMLLFVLLFMASILGNQVNFLVGRAIGLVSLALNAPGY